MVAELCVILLTALALVGMNVSSASAGTDNYPNKNDAWCTTNLYQGASHTPPVGLTNPPNSNCTLQPADTIVPPNSTSSGFYKRECTSFVSWRMINNNGMTGFRNSMGGYTLSDAGNWGAAAQNMGYAVNMTPAAGAVAWWSSGHVAWVESVSGSNVTIEEYNWNYTHNYGTRTIAANSVSGFIHFQDLVPPPPAWPGIGTSATFLGTDTLAAGQQLVPNQYIESADARFAMLLSSDGNIILYGGRDIWSSGAHPGATRLSMQTDGNLVLYNANNVPLWFTGTGGINNSSHLTLQTDGNLVVYRDSGGWTWQSGTGGRGVTTPFSTATPDRLNGAQEEWLNGSVQHYLRSPDKRYALLLQSDGSLVLYGPGYHVLTWFLQYSGATRLVMQADGNLVLYNSANTPLWYTGTTGTGNRLVLQNDGNLVLYRADNSWVWQSGTGGQI